MRTSRRFERERQLELDEDPLVGQVRELEDVRHRAQRVPPGRDLGRRRPVPELVEEAVGELVREACLRRVGDELLGRALVEVQPLPSPVDDRPEIDVARLYRPGMAQRQADRNVEATSRASRSTSSAGSLEGIDRITFNSPRWDTSSMPSIRVLPNQGNSPSTTQMMPAASVTPRADWSEAICRFTCSTNSVFRRPLR